MLIASESHQYAPCPNSGYLFGAIAQIGLGYGGQKAATNFQQLSTTIDEVIREALTLVKAAFLQMCKAYLPSRGAPTDCLIDVTPVPDSVSLYQVGVRA